MSIASVTNPRQNKGGKWVLTVYTYEHTSYTCSLAKCKKRT